MEDVLQRCGDACESFCTAYNFFAWTLPPPSNDAPEFNGNVVENCTQSKYIGYNLKYCLSNETNVAQSVPQQQSLVTTRAAQRSERVLFSVVPVCDFVGLFVCLSFFVNTITPEPLEITVTKLSGHHPMIKREANFENGFTWERG